MITNSECIHDPRERPSLTEGQARYVSNVSRDMWLGGIQECLRLAKEYVLSEQLRVFDETGQPFDRIDWTKFEKQLERL